MYKFFTKYLLSLILVLFGIFLTLTVVFLYNNFYKTYIQADEVVVLRQQVTPVVFDENLWIQVLANLDQKLVPKEIPENIKDPFEL
jgi:hypothetical protein